MQSSEVRHSSPSSACTSQIPFGSLTQRPVMQSVEAVQLPPRGIMQVDCAKQKPNRQSLSSLHGDPGGERGTHRATSPWAVASTTSHRSSAVQSVVDWQWLGQMLLKQYPESHWKLSVQSDPAESSGMSSHKRSCSISCASPQCCPMGHPSSLSQLWRLIWRCRCCSWLMAVISDLVPRRAVVRLGRTARARTLVYLMNFIVLLWLFVCFVVCSLDRLLDCEVMRLVGWI